MGNVPKELRGQLEGALDDLVSERVAEERLVWVRNYGESGATLVSPPEAIWSHPRTDAVATQAGGWHIVLPLWTTDEAPSDLSAEFRVDADGTVELLDVHVL